MAERDSGWIHLYCEDGQEVYDTMVMAVRIAEHKDVLLPVFVCQDGFITSHCFEPVEFMDDGEVREFIGKGTRCSPSSTWTTPLLTDRWL